MADSEQPATMGSNDSHTYLGAHTRGTCGGAYTGRPQSEGRVEREGERKKTHMDPSIRWVAQLLGRDAGGQTDPHTRSAATRTWAHILLGNNATTIFLLVKLDYILV